MKAQVVTAKNGQKTVENMCAQPCPIERGMRVLGGKWTGSILWHLQEGPVRFNDLARMIGGASKKMISQRLQEMEDKGMVTRHVLSGKPVAVAYEITDFGKSALSILDDLKNWVDQNDL